MRIPAAAGTPQTLAIPDPKKNELFYFSPQLLPGGKQVLFSIALAGGGETAALDLRTGEKKILFENVIAASRYVPTGSGSSAGHIIYYKAGSLMAVAFNRAGWRRRAPQSPFWMESRVTAAAHLPC
jgi:hypothetical protein